MLKIEFSGENKKYEASQLRYPSIITTKDTKIKVKNASFDLSKQFKSKDIDNWVLFYPQNHQKFADEFIDKIYSIGRKEDIYVDYPDSYKITKRFSIEYFERQVKKIK